MTMPRLSNIREFLGWTVGRTIVEVTAGDPTEIPDGEGIDAHFIVLHFDNGGTLEISVGEDGFSYFNPEGKDDDA